MDEVKRAGASREKVAVAALRGRAVDVLPVYVAGNGIDLVVLDVANRHRLAKWVMGNTAERILDKLPCSVLTVRGDAA